MLEGGLYEDIQFDESEQGEMKYFWSVVQSVCSFPLLLSPPPDVCPTFSHFNFV